MPVTFAALMCHAPIVLPDVAGAEARQAVLARLPGYRLSKFQDCLPEAFALEMIESYLLDVEGTIGFLRAVLG